MWGWSPFDQKERPQQASFGEMKELLLYEIDRLVRQEAKATENVITEEV